MKVTRILVVALLLVAVATAANAQPKIRLAWNSCTWTGANNQLYTGPVIYKLVVAAFNVPAVTYFGHDTRVAISAGPAAFPDAWRFDTPDGCAAGNVAYATSGLTKSCIAFGNVAPLAITNYYFGIGDGDPAYQDAGIRLANAFSDFTPSGVLTQQYTLFQVSFNHVYSDIGPQDPQVACGNADQGLTFTDWLTEIAETISGNKIVAGHDGTENVVCWQGCAPAEVSAQTATWGRVKGMYR